MMLLKLFIETIGIGNDNHVRPERVSLRMSHKSVNMSPATGLVRLT